jgi:drug/metabolite transporter (DMT)-like permease
MMLGVQLLTIVLGAGLLFYLFGIHPHPRHVMLASWLTAGYVVVGMIGLVTMQWTWRKRARQLRATQTGA